MTDKLNKLSLLAQAETVRSLEKALAGSKLYSVSESQLLSDRAAITARTLELFAEHEDAIRECIRTRLHLKANGGEA